ncbi:MAG: magnesium transporter [Planctomycetia bacterium]|nr:magnesium transporter [Planctomycetia bacterium]
MNETAPSALGEAAPRAETAGRHLVDRVPIGGPDDSVAMVREGLVGRNFDALEAVYVLDGQRRLQGIVRLVDLFALPGEKRLDEVMEAPPPPTRVSDDQEHIALRAIRHRLGAVPVLNTAGQFLGVVPPLALIEVLRREHVEDLHRLTGILAANHLVEESMRASPGRRLLDRLPWLLVGLLGSMLATLVMASFEHVLQAQVAVAFFVPAIVYLADAIGTQTEAIAVRYLSMRHVPLGELLLGELLAGLLIGLSLGLLVFPAVALGFGNPRLALAVSLAIVFAGGCAASIGLVFPWLLSRAGWDPAFGSGPAATIIQDVLSLLIYFAMVVALVR